MNNEESYLDFEMLAQGVADLREGIRAMVNCLVAEGFTAEQAREIVAGSFAQLRKG